VSIGPFSQYFHDEFNFAWRKLEEHLSSFAVEDRVWGDADVLLQKRGLHYLRGMARHLPQPAVSEILAMLAEYDALLPALADVTVSNLKSSIEVLHSLYQCFLKQLDEMTAPEKAPVVPSEDPKTSEDSRVLKFMIGDRLLDLSVASTGPQKFDATPVENLKVEESSTPADPRVLGVEFMAKIFDQSEIWPVSSTSLMAVKQKLMHLKEIEGDKKLTHVMLDELVRDFGRLEQRLSCQTVFKPFRENGAISLYALGGLHFSLIDEQCSLPKQAVGNLLRGLVAVAANLPSTMSKCMFQLAPHLGKHGFVADLFCDEIGFFHWKQACKNLDNAKFGWEIVVLEEKCFFRIYLDESVGKHSAFLVKSNDPHFKGVWAIPSSAVKRFAVLGKKSQEKLQGPREIKKLPGHTSGGATISLTIQWKGEDFYLEAQDVVGEELITVGSESSIYAPYACGLSDSGRQVIWFDLDLFLNSAASTREAA